MFVKEGIGRMTLFLIPSTRNVSLAILCAILVLMTRTNVKNALMECSDILDNFVNHFVRNLILKIQLTGFVITNQKTLLTILDVLKHNTDQYPQDHVQPHVLPIVKPVT